MRYIAPMLIIMSLLAGCAESGKLSTFTPVCDALVKPYKYNTFRPSSRRHAGVDLAVDLKQHNQIYTGLNCPKK